jgi:hypothetical protein
MFGRHCWGKLDSKETVMKKTVKKLTLHRETLSALSDLRLVVGAVDTGKRKL